MQEKEETTANQRRRKIKISASCWVDTFLWADSSQALQTSKWIQRGLTEKLKEEPPPADVAPA